MRVLGNRHDGNEFDCFPLFLRAGQAMLNRSSSLNVLQVVQLAFVMLL